MNDKNNPQSILGKAYHAAVLNIKKDREPLIEVQNSEEIDKQINIIVERCISQKAVTTALITSLVKKIENPKQDIRLHKTEFNGGYSARSYDTHNITPFLKRNLPRIAMKESGWLTRSIEQPHPFDKNFPGKIRDDRVKKAFLFLIDQVEKHNLNSQLLLEVLLTRLVWRLKEDMKVVSSAKKVDESSMILEIIRMLNTHFKCKKSSFLPVIALYSMYQLVIKEVSRYEGKKLLPLKSHTAADIKSKSTGDIEIVDRKGNLFEAAEVKHKIKIDEYTLIDVIRKIRGKGVNRYYILTTAYPEIKEGEEDELAKKIKEVKLKDGCEIVLNGVFPTIKYYLRLINSPKDFINTYTKNLISLYKQSSSVLKEHIGIWNKIVRKK